MEINFIGWMYVVLPSAKILLTSEVQVRIIFHFVAKINFFPNLFAFKNFTLGYPSEYSTAGSCSFILNYVQDDICQIRYNFIFIKFRIRVNTKI